MSGENFQDNKMDAIKYDCRWSDALDEKFIADYLLVQNRVFGHGTREEFRRQFENNIFGRSVIEVVYIGSKPAAARALWRNDVCGREAYQPGSTCVLESCRGKGIFKEMTKRAISMLPTGAVVYNFPNPNSFPGYIRMGWTLLHDYSVRLLTSYESYKKEHPVIMDKEYAEWWVTGRELYHTKCRGHYFLMHKDHRPLCYRILAEVEGSVAKKFPYARYGLFFYKSERATWYNRRLAKSHVVTRNPELGYIPTWKIDAV